MNREVEEAVAKAKDALLNALRVAERAGNASLAKKLDALCGKTETLQRKMISERRRLGNE